MKKPPIDCVKCEKLNPFLLVADNVVEEFSTSEKLSLNCS
jgi:hypothetical protein